MHLRLNALLSVGLLALSAPLWAAKRVDLDYQVRFLPASDEAEVRLTLAKGELIHSLAFALGTSGQYRDFKADGQWLLTPGKNARGVWRPTRDKASLTYRVRISHGRKNGSFDTRMTPTWALLQTKCAPTAACPPCPCCGMGCRRARRWGRICMRPGRRRRAARCMRPWG